MCETFCNFKLMYLHAQIGQHTKESYQMSKQSFSGRFFVKNKNHLDLKKWKWKYNGNIHIHKHDNIPTKIYIIPHVGNLYSFVVIVTTSLDKTFSILGVCYVQMQRRFEYVAHSKRKWNNLAHATDLTA